MGPLATRFLVSTALAALLGGLLIAGLALAQDDEGLTPSFGDGRLTITGGGFGPGEQVTLTVRAGGTSQEFMATADARGQFRLVTGLAVQPGASVRIEARGDQGTTQVAITTASGGLPFPPGPEPEDDPSPGPGGIVPTVRD